MIFPNGQKEKYFLFLCTLIMHSQAMTDDEVSEIEKSILDYHEYIDGVMWNWDLPMAHRRFPTWCPTDTNYGGSELKPMDVMLELQNCRRIRMNVAELSCEKLTKPGVKTDISHPKFIIGVNGEAYEVSAPGEKTKCEDLSTLTLDRCVSDGSYNVKSNAEVEKIFFDNREALSGLKWNSPSAMCTFLFADDSFHPLKGEAGPMDLILESQNGARIPMEVLNCFFKNEPVITMYVRGRDLEVYSVLRTREESQFYEENKSSVYFSNRVVDQKGVRTKRLCPTV